jgi:carboxymethylenebutenolidase
VADQRSDRGETCKKQQDFKNINGAITRGAGGKDGRHAAVSGKPADDVAQYPAKRDANAGTVYQDALATEGYVVVAPDTLRGNATRWFPRALYQSITASAERVSTDLDSVLRALRSDPLVDPQRIAVMGFCFGGTQALAYSLSRPDAVAATAVFYGSVGDDAEALARLRGPVLGIFGESDHLIPLTSVAAFEGALMASGTPHRIEVFPGVGHAFVTSVEGIASDPIQAAAWGMLRDFLAETLGRAE